MKDLNVNNNDQISKIWNGMEWNKLQLKELDHF